MLLNFINIAFQPSFFCFMYKVQHLLYAFLFGALFVSACKKEETAGASSEQGIVFSATKEAVTKAGLTGFELNDRVGVFIVRHQNDGTPGNLASDNYVVNRKFTRGANGLFAPETIVRWYNAAQGESIKSDFYAYYPYNADLNLNRLDEVPFSVQADQSTLAQLTASDFMWVRALDKQPSEGPLALQFKHVMSRFVINVKASSGTLDPSKLSVRLVNVRTSLTLNLNDMTFDDRSNIGSIVPYKQTTPQAGYAATYVAILPSQVIRENMVELVYDAGAAKFWKPSGDTYSLCPSQEYTLNVAINPVELLPTGTNNLYGVIKDDQGIGIANVSVTDGYQCVLTDSKGFYQMTRNASSTFVYFSCPEQYEIPLNTYANPQMYSVITAGTGLVRKDFILTRLPAVETNFHLIAMGDPQCRKTNITRFNKETIADLNNEVKTLPYPVYGIVLGDVTYDDATAFSGMRTALGTILDKNQKVVRMFTTPGNHDETSGSTANYTTYFGPLNYSFNRGNVHIVSLNNILWPTSNYTAGFTAEQIEWLRQDLSSVSKSKKVIVFYHIPLRTTSYANASAMKNLLKQFPEATLFAGHTHFNEYTENTSGSTYLLERTLGGACGTWWYSTVNVDGTPNGYGLYTLNGTKIVDGYYKASIWDKSYQIRLHRGTTAFVGQYETMSYSLYNPSLSFTANTVIANVWGYNPQWKVEVYEDGFLRGQMTRITAKSSDGWACGYHIGQLGRGGVNGGTRSNYEAKHMHCFYYNPENTSAAIKVVATDEWGNKYEQTTFTTTFTEAINPTY